MCGISFLNLNKNNKENLNEINKIWNQILINIQSRGPDSFQTEEIIINKENNSENNNENNNENNSENNSENSKNIFSCGVLHIQGNIITKQPLKDCLNNNLLLWNGEVFNGINRIEGLSDTEMILNEINQQIKSYQIQNINKSEVSKLSISDVGRCLSQFLSYIQGPYAFIFYYASLQTIFYGRDPFGRRSLLGLTLKNQNNNNNNNNNDNDKIDNDNEIENPSIEEESNQNETNQLNKQLENHIIITSVCSEIELGENYQLVELPVSGIFAQYIGDDSFDSPINMHFPWPETRIRLERKYDHINSLSSPSSQLSSSSLFEYPSAQFLSILTNVMKNRIHCVHSVIHSNDENQDKNNNHNDEDDKKISLQENVCEIGVLFSGGIDSVLIAAILHLSLPEEMSHLTIDLLNVTFEGQANVNSNDNKNTNKKKYSSPDRLAAIAALGELEIIFPTRKWRLVHIDVSSEERNQYENHIYGLIQPLKTHMDLNIGTAFWFASRGIGYLKNYSFEDYKQVYNFEENGRPLLRIGEEGARRGKGQKNKKNIQEEVTNLTKSESNGEKLESIEQKNGDELEVIDKRKLGSQKNFCRKEKCRKVSKPGCPMNYCKICCEKLQKENETYECSAHRNTKLTSISNTKSNQKLELIDNQEFKSLNINNEEGINIESKQDQQIDNNNNKDEKDNQLFRELYKSPCKILLVGIGADEQMAGYGRHRTTFEKFGWNGLVKELHSDMARLWTRNLGRDDRCASDHGRELWFPFLDEEVVNFLQNLPINQICDLTLPFGVGDKKILRDAGKLIGLTNSTELVKRAIQFGTRVAKHTNVKYHGSNRKGKGTTEIDLDDS